MCGIAGFVDFNKNSSSSILESCTNILSHRGPDDCGYEFIAENDYQVGLGHRRLSIIDLSSGARQPMWFEKWCILFNGEIYNYGELRNELLQAGHSFQTHSDTEVILHAWQEWGVKMVDRFIGMFVFVIYDSEKKTITCFRDRAGVKPFYYYHADGLFLFGSELKSFHKHPGFKKQVNIQAVHQFLQYGYIIAPLCIFRNTCKLLPGHYLEFNINSKKPEVHKYWDVYDHYNKPKLKISNKEAETEMEKLLISACSYRMVSDVPVGVFLSGGYDSTAVAALIQASGTEKIRTYTIGFLEEDHNEAGYALEVAKHLGTNHTEHYCTIKEAQEFIPDIPFYCDEPFGDSSIIPTMLVSKLARKDVTVALSADAGDEVFAGYAKYPLALQLKQQMNLIPDALKKPAGKILRIIPGKMLEQVSGNVAASIKKERFSDALENNSLSAIHIMDSFLSQVYSDKQLTALFKERVSKPDSFFNAKNKLHFTLADLDMLLALDYKTYLPDDILVKVDRAGMAFSLEGREPLVDHRLIEFAARLPHTFKMNGNEKKVMLRNIVHRYVPKKLMDRPKMGFGVPVFKWLRTDLKFYVDEYMSDAAFARHGIFNPDEISHIMQQFLKGNRNYNSLFWYLLMFQMWYKKWMD